MAVPKRKTTRMKRGQRRSHLALKTITVSENKTTGEYARPHHISKDGYYNGKQVIIKRVAEEAEEVA
ncbi:MAG TPA: 50S ribosomal protein L32 [Alphaproteobacteria bacterium]|nr:50S ribosomal protein L32 [Alphaproteobacteria bacterium]